MVFWGSSGGPLGSSGELWGSSAELWGISDEDQDQEPHPFRVPRRPIPYKKISQTPDRPPLEAVMLIIHA